MTSDSGDKLCAIHGNATPEYEAAMRVYELGVVLHVYTQ